MAKDGAVSRTASTRAARRSVLRARTPDGHPVSLLRVSNTWDHAAFRDYVLQSARNAGHVIDSTADVAALTKDAEGREEVGRAMLSKWFRGLEQPSVASLRRLARHLGAPLPDLLVLAGRGDADELGTVPAPFVAPALHRQARELNEMLADDSPVPPERRARLEEMIDRIMEEDRRYMRVAKQRRRYPA